MGQERWLHPYLPISVLSDDVIPDLIRDQVVANLLREHALNQASRILSAIEVAAFDPDKLPKVLVSVDRETDGLSSPRVANMLRAFQHFLQNELLFGGSLATGRKFHLRTFDPMITSDKSHVTSPTLLAIQAIVHSHSQWFRTRHHQTYAAWEAHSAWETFKRLEEVNNPPIDLQHRAFIAALIAHQTQLRGALNLQFGAGGKKEVVAYDSVTGTMTSLCRSDDENADDKLVAQALARTLFSFFKEPLESQAKEQLAAALVLSSLCLEFRHQRISGDLKEREISRILNFSKWISQSPPPTDITHRLIFWQFGHRVQKKIEEVDWNKLFGDIIKKQIEKQRPWGRNFTFCFNPNTSRKFWHAWDRQISWDDIIDLPSCGNGNEYENHICAAICEVIGHVRATGPQKVEALLLSLDLGQESRNMLEVQSWAKCEGDTLRAFHEIVEKLRSIHFTEFDELTTAGQYIEARYFPTPLVGRILRQMYRIQPKKFSILRLRPKGLPASVANTPFITRSFTIYLPRDPVPEEDNIAREAVGLIARYVAAMIVNLQVSLAPRSIELDFFCDEVRDRWDLSASGPSLIRSALGTGHEGIIRFLEQYRAEVCDIPTIEALDDVAITSTLPPDYKVNKPHILGIDVGATSIKVGLMRATMIEKERKPGLTDDLNVFEFPTAAGSTRYESARDFAIKTVERIIERLHKENEQYNNWLKDVGAVGIAWPGPVRRGSIVAASSSILNKFKGFEGKSKDDDPREVHKLDLREAFQYAFNKIAGLQEVFVTVLNDGDADVKGEEPLSEKRRSQGVSVVLKQGSGTACGVYVDGKQVPIMAEFGKAVLNLDAKPLDNFPGGTVNAYCSKKTLPAIATGLGWVAPPGTPDIDARELGYFLAKSRCQDPNLHEEGTTEEIDKIINEIAREIVFRRFSDLLAGPDDIVEAMPGDGLGLFFPMGLKLPEIASQRIAQLEKAVLTGTPEDLAKKCAKITGYLLADAIALLVDIFRCREVRLAGGPLSGSTGEEVACNAGKRLNTVYDLAIETGQEKHPLDPHVLMVVSRILLISSQPSKGHTGVRGAARATLEEFVREIKRRALAAARAYLANEHVREPFTIDGLLKNEDFRSKIAIGSCVPLEAEDLRRLIEAYMTSLGLTLQTSGKYAKPHSD